MADSNRPQAVRATLGVRLVAGLYDAFILLGLAFLAFIVVTWAEHQWGEIPRWIKGMLVITIGYAYFVGFWVRGGATTGMRPWKLVVADTDTGEFPSLAQASFRYAGLMITWIALAMVLIYMALGDTNHALFFIAAGLPAASLACMMLTRHRQTLHDLISGTSVYRVR